MLANAGITSPNGEAVFYNPANLTRIEGAELSVSGSTYLRFELETDGFLLLDGEPQPFEASGFMAIPATMVSTYSFGKWGLATAVIVPDAFELKTWKTFKSQESTVSDLYDIRSSSLWIGAGVGREISKDLSFGMSAFVSNETSSTLIVSRYEESVQGEDGPESLVVQQLTNMDGSVFNLSAIAGAYWQPSPRLTLGARVHSAMRRLSGTGRLYMSMLSSVDEPGMANVVVDIDSYEIASPLPWDVGAGVAFHPWDELELVADLNVQLPATLQITDSPEAGEEEREVQAAPRLGLGAEWAVNRNVILRLGFAINRSAIPETDGVEDLAENFWGTTGGVSWSKGRTMTSVGVFFLNAQSVSFMYDGEAPPIKTQSRSRIYGSVLSFAYKL